MKQIYFVRHGESVGNVGPLRQEAHTPLNEKGTAQAEIMARCCARLPIEVIFTSTYERAKTTATIINNVISKPIIFTDDITELRQPSVVYGKPKDDPMVMEVQEIFWSSFTDPNKKHSDEEKFIDVKTRVANFFKLMSDRPEDHILVVTHGALLRIAASYIAHGDNLTAQECLDFCRHFHMDNTGLTIVGHDPKERFPWWIKTWNDHAHLG